MKTLKQFMYSPEHIRFQDPAFAEKLIQHFETIYDYILDGNTEENRKLIVRELYLVTEKVKERTGIKTKFSLEFDGGNGIGFTCMPILHGNHIFGRPAEFGYQEKDPNKIIQKMHEFNTKTFVDLENAKVGGVFSDVNFEIVLDVADLALTKITPREATAIFLHELGHCFIQMQFIFHGVLTNQALAAVSRSLSNNDPAKTEYVLKAIGKEIGNDETFLLEIQELTDKKLIVSTTMGRVMHKLRSNLSKDIYHSAECEAAADAFATRFGLGRDLATGVGKIQRKFDPQDYSAFLRLQYTIGHFLTAVLVPVSFIIGVGVLGGILGFSIACYLAATSEQIKHGHYPDNKARLAKIKEQVMHQMKNKQISDKEKNVFLNQIKDIEKEIDKVKVWRGLPQFFLETFIPSHRRRKSMQELERDLEMLAANDIFARAAELSLIK